MSAIIKLSSKLPGDEEINGLDAIVEHFKDSEEPVLVLAWVVSKQVTRITGTDEEVPTVEVRRVEPIGTADDVPQTVQDLAAELYERRTGRNPLPIGQLLAPAGDVDVWGDEQESDEEHDVDEVAEADEPRLAAVTDVFGMPEDVEGEQ